MPKLLPTPQLNDRSLALAIIQALQLWSDDRYQQFIGGDDASLNAAWLKWFVGEWNVARTIQRGKLDEVRLYLDQDFRSALKEDTSGKAIDDAASYLRATGCSAKLGRNGVPALPISLVSKIGFFLRPADLVPLDRYSRIGLNKLRSTTGTPKLKDVSYQEYLAAFNQQFDSVAFQISQSLSEVWVNTVAQKLNCPSSALKTNALCRKVFDSYLMHTGGFLKISPKPNK